MEDVVVEKCSNCMWVGMGHCESRVVCDKFSPISDDGIEIGSLIKMADVKEYAWVEMSSGIKDIISVSGVNSDPGIIIGMEDEVIDTYSFVDENGKYGRCGKNYKVKVIK